MSYKIARWWVRRIVVFRKKMNPLDFLKIIGRVGRIGATMITASGLISCSYGGKLTCGGFEPTTILTVSGPGVGPVVGAYTIPFPFFGGSDIENFSPIDVNASLTTHTELGSLPLSG